MNLLTKKKKPFLKKATRQWILLYFVIPQHSNPQHWYIICKSILLVKVDLWFVWSCLSVPNVKGCIFCFLWPFLVFLPSIQINKAQLYFPLWQLLKYTRACYIVTMRCLTFIMKIITSWHIYYYFKALIKKILCSSILHK